MTRQKRLDGDIWKTTVETVTISATCPHMPLPAARPAGFITVLFCLVLAPVEAAFGSNESHIAIGSSPEAVSNLLGSPKGAIRSGSREVWSYDRGFVTFRDRKVTEVDLMSDVDIEQREAMRKKDEIARQEAIAEEEKARQALLDKEKARQALLDVETPWSEVCGGLMARIKPIDHRFADGQWSAVPEEKSPDASTYYTLNLQVEIKNTTTAVVNIVSDISEGYRLESICPNQRAYGISFRCRNPSDGDYTSSIAPGEIWKWTFYHSVEKGCSYHDLRFKCRIPPGLQGVWSGKLTTPWIRIRNPFPSGTLDPWDRMSHLGFSEGLAPVVVSNLWGFINTNGVIVITPRYDLVSRYINGFAMVSILPYEENCYYIDHNGEYAGTNMVRASFSYHEGLLLRITTNSLAGFVNTNGDWAIRPNWIYPDRYMWEKESCALWMFSEGMASIEINGRAGFINMAGKLVIEPRFEEAYCFKDGLALVRVDGKYGFIDSSGKMAIAADYTLAHDFCFERAAVCVGGDYDPDWGDDIRGKWGFVDKTGRLVVPAKYDEVRSFVGGIAFVETGGKWSLIDTAGNCIPCASFDSVSWGKEGMTRVMRDHKSGFINTNGVICVPLEYDDVKNFSEGKAGVKKDGKWGFVNKDGRLVLPLDYDDVRSFDGGVCPVKIKAKWGLIDQSGKLVVPCKFDLISHRRSEGYWTVYEDGAWGYIDSAGNYVWKPTR